MTALDKEFLDELLDGDREFGAELFEAFDEASSQWLGEAASACREGNVVQATRAFHTLKGSAAAVGLTGLRDLSKELESLAKDGNLAVCAPRLGELEALVQEGRSLLAGFLESL